MDFFATDQSGIAVLDHTVQLTNASVALYRSSADVATPTPQTDTIELVYQTLEITDHRGKGVVNDSLINSLIAP
jgi:hypothetical protein